MAAPPPPAGAVAPISIFKLMQKNVHTVFSFCSRPYHERIAFLVALPGAGLGGEVRDT